MMENEPDRAAASLGRGLVRYAIYGVYDFSFFRDLEVLQGNRASLHRREECPTKTPKVSGVFANRH